MFCFGVWPCLLTVWFLAVAAQQHVFAIDFHHAFWPAGRAVLEGTSPYPPATEASLSTGTAFVYPAPMAYLMAPFALLPHALADIVFTLLLAGAAFLTLRLLRVSDWRCYGAVFLWAAVFSALQTASLTLLLGLGAAVLWRFRARTGVAAAVTAAIVCAKLFLWPLGIWLIATRRYRAAAYALLLAVGVTLVAWAGLGFAGLLEFPSLLRTLTRLEEGESYTLYALAVELGADPVVSRALPYVAGGAVLLVAILLGRRGPDDPRAFVLALAASLLLSPIVWLHYFALLIVPLALSRPRFSAIWLVPAVCWVAAGKGNGVEWQTLLVLLSSALVVAGALSRPGRVITPSAGRTTGQPQVASRSSGA